MIKVEKTAKTLDEGIKNLMAGAKLDYSKVVYSKRTKNCLVITQKNKLIVGIVKQKFTMVKSTSRLYKILVFFVLSQKKILNIFKKGDILKAAGYNAPALNSARGNVLTGNYAIQWTGPLYLK